MKIPEEHTIQINDRIIKISRTDNNRYSVNGETRNVDFFPQGRIYRVRYQDQNLNVFIKKIAINVYEVWIKHHIVRVFLHDHRSMLMTNFSTSTSVKDKSFAIKAPMPGIVVNMMVKKGDYVQKGSELIILEAMKMENKLISTSSGYIMSILIKQGEIVEKDQILLTINND
jgi:biotin carboxyl carrier protein